MGARSRRRFLQGSLALAGFGLLAGCAALPLGPRRQARLPRVGYLDSSSSQDRADGFRLGLADHGYVEGRNIIVEWRNTEGQLDRLPGLAAELVGLPVDVLVASGDIPTRLLRDATGTVPIVMVVSASPVEAGFVVSLARPGGNVTGLTTFARELDRKRLELLKETVPGLARVGVLWNPATDRTDVYRELEEVAGTLGLEVRSLEARDHGALEAAFERAAAERVDGLFLIDNSVLTANRPRIVEFARRHRLPTSSVLRSTVAAGGLLAYGPNIPSLNRRAAGYVDRILKGADPAELPVERPTAFELVINLGTARELGLTIPPSVLQQATEVIQ